MGIMKFQEQVMAWSHCPFSAFEQLQIFGEYFNFFQIAEKFCQVRKSIFCTFGKRRVGKNCNLAKQITFKLEMALFQGTAGEGYFPIFFHLLNTQYRRSLKYVPAMATPLC